MLCHPLLEVVLVHGNPALERQLAGQLEREAVGRGQVERLLAGDGAARGDLLEELHPARQRLGETLFLGAQHVTDPLAILRQLREPVAHLLDHGVADPPEIVEPDRSRLVDGATDDPSQHVATTLVRRRDAVGDEEGHPAAVVGEDPVRLRGGLGVAEGDAALVRDPVHDRLIAVRFVDRADVLHHRCEPLETQARVDVLLRERCQRPVRVLLELHEDEVPELEEAIAAWACGGARRVAAAVLGSPIPVDLGVGAAGAGATDRPEVLDARECDDALGRHSDRLPLLDRDLVRAELEDRVAGVNGHPDAIPVELQPLLDELGRELDRAFLEVLAEREVAEHLEERQVVPVEADLVDVLRPEALLRGGRERRRRRLEAEEERHLRLHAGARQQRRMIVRSRDQRP